MEIINLKPGPSRMPGDSPIHSRVKILSGGQEIELDHVYNEEGGCLWVRWQGFQFYMEPTNSAGHAIELFSVFEEATNKVSRSIEHETLLADA